MNADRTVYPDTRHGGDARCFYCHNPVGGLHELDCPVFKDCDVTVTLRRTSDGVTRKWTEARNSLCDPRYWWEEGNGSCDCNRTIYFARAGGEEEPDDDEYLCGDTAFELVDLKVVMRQPVAP